MYFLKIILFLIATIGDANLTCIGDPTFVETQIELNATVNLNEKSITPPLEQDTIKTTANKVVTEKTRMEVYTVVSRQPEFPGGKEKLTEFIVNNSFFPIESQIKNNQRTVLVKFIVTDEGKITESKIIKSVSPKLDEEALRLLNIMPPWQPGELKEKKVNVYYTLPVRFALQH